MDFFDFYKFEPSFLLDEAELKKCFLQKSREYHPDFYTLESAEKQAEILQISTKNNEAYKVLADFDLRMKYILNEKNILLGEGKDKLDQSFLMEMMEINEEMMEVQMDPNPASIVSISTQIEAFEKNLFASITSFLKKPLDAMTEKELAEIKQYYLKKKYLLRLKENLGQVGV